MARKLLRLAAFGALAFIFAAGGAVWLTEWNEARTKEPIALKAGFTGLEEMRAAEAAGFSEPGKYRAHQSKVALAAAEREAANRAELARITEYSSDQSHRLQMVKSGWSKGGFDNVGLMTWTIKSAAEFPIKDISIRCTFYGASGTEISRSTYTVFDQIKPKSSKTFKDVNIGLIDRQSATANCAIVAARHS